ncbi:low molecular weight protein-tyrosine-phosphatase [Maribacter chungangensis]|uniref:protein-tyrosine-phosphatase n=1 Tax=Maribacter chungangensis TaxID=1069117 RepID=A0ABW3B4E1_9FLAO
MRTNVLMVCLGNICRSPLAEGILKSKVDPERVFVDSAGTAGYHINNPPDPRSIEVAKKYGVDIAEQRCRQFNIQDFDLFDVIYAMDKENYYNIIKLSSSAADRSKVHLLLGEIDGSANEVPDPYYGGVEGFEHVFQMIANACEQIAKRL